MIYFIAEIEDGLDETPRYVKIGVSNDPWKRLKTFQTGNPDQLELLLVLRSPRGLDDYDLESYLHKKFARNHHAGEWFVLSARIQEFINNQQSGVVYRPTTNKIWRLVKIMLIGSGLLCAVSVTIMYLINNI